MQTANSLNIAGRQERFRKTVILNWQIICSTTIGVYDDDTCDADLISLSFILEPRNRNDNKSYK